MLMEDRKIYRPQRGENFSSFMSLKKFISNYLVQFIYVSGVIFITISGLNKFFENQHDALGFSNFSAGNNMLTGMLIIVAGNLLWRLICEASVVLFSMHDSLPRSKKD